MKKYLFTTLILFSLYNELQAQDTELHVKNVDVHFQPLSLIAWSPRTTLGVEVRSNKRLAYALDIGYGAHDLNFDRFYWDEGYRFLEIRPQIKYYFKSNSNRYGYYCALELFYIHISDQIQNEYYHKASNSQVLSFDSADFDKTKHGLHIIGGVSLIAYKKISFDLFVGFGAAIRKITYQNVINPEEIEYPRYEWYIPTNLFEQQRLDFHMTLGTKIGFNFNKY
ncbi:hypothetical protein [uncultured Arcticibacterium sp.]|uniref:hypothetical protein n=1 Tax=uncultured Arcticibacterium sp. TaxID=2173042 RepID=UPI0030F6FFB5